MSESFFRNATRDDGAEILVEIAVTSWGFPAQTYGPPEDCYPAEGMEIEIVGAWPLGVDRASTLNAIPLTEAEAERIETEFHENPPEPDDGYDG